MDRSPQRITWDAASQSIRAKHSHTTLTHLNDHELILAVNEVAYPWHRHPDSDELLIVVDGRLEIECESGAPLDLHAGEGVLIPAGTRHRTRPHGRAVNLVFRRMGAETSFDET